MVWFAMKRVPGTATTIFPAGGILSEGRRRAGCMAPNRSRGSYERAAVRPRQSGMIRELLFR